MNTTELIRVIGKTGLLAGRRNALGRQIELNVSVRITDVRNTRFGHIDYLVTPIAGEGEVWVDSERVTLD